MLNWILYILKNSANQVFFKKMLKLKKGNVKTTITAYYSPGLTNFVPSSFLLILHCLDNIINRQWQCSTLPRFMLFSTPSSSTICVKTFPQIMI